MIIEVGLISNERVRHREYDIDEVHLYFGNRHLCILEATKGMSFEDVDKVKDWGDGIDIIYSIWSYFFLNV